MSAAAGPAVPTTTSAAKTSARTKALPFANNVCAIFLSFLPEECLLWMATPFLFLGRSMGVRRKKVINLMVEREINRSAIKLSTYGSMTPSIKRTIKEGFRILRVKGLAPTLRGGLPLFTENPRRGVLGNQFRHLAFSETTFTRSGTPA
jgi:hypothetical protein